MLSTVDTTFEFLNYTTMENQELPLGMIVSGMMKQFFRILRKRIHEFDSDSTIEQMGILHAIKSKQEDMIQQNMADLLGKDKSSILRSIDLLEKRGLLHRIKDPNDRRKNIISLSESGKEKLHQHFEMERKLTDSLIEGINEAELKNFYAVISRIKDNAERLSESKEE